MSSPRPHFPPLGPLQGLTTRLRLWRCESVGDSPRIFGRVWIRGGGEIHLGSRVVLDGREAPIELHAEPGGRLVIADDVVIEGGTSIEAQASVTIGPRTWLGPFCKVLDTHFHPLKGNRYERPPAHPLVIEADVTVGARTILLAGTHLHQGVKVAPGTVVSRMVPAGLTIAGMPARVVRQEGAP